MQVRMADLGSQYLRIRDEVEPLLLEVLASGRYVLGEHVQRLEDEVAQACNARFAIGVSSGTDALKIALRAVGIQPGDEVITTPFTFVSTAEVIVQLGATPIFVDIDPETYNIDPARLAEAVTPRTRAWARSTSSHTALSSQRATTCPTEYSPSSACTSSSTPYNRCQVSECSAARGKASSTSRQHSGARISSPSIASMAVTSPGDSPLIEAS